jgi:hypothetical protein
MSLRTYRVTFTSKRWLRIDLEARSHPAAIVEAESLWQQCGPDDVRFEEIGGEPFGNAEVEEVQP